MTTRPAPTRLARAVLLAVTSAALSVAAHGAAGGEVTDFAPALPLTLLIAFAGTVLAERGRSPWTLLATLGVAQVGQHVLLNLGGHDHTRAPGLDIDPAAMTAAHAVAALLTGLLLARADAVLTALARALAGVLSRLLPVPGALPRPASRVPAPVPSTAANALVDVLLRRVHGRRGPPSPLITRVH
ncbi:hypothetical protein [Saccharothrix coeruleofusca]|uniref:MFS transporter n=1 Tax=Saccharothrix coeruleofusca TaxID=33919 RepID=A0A918AGC4_9PSEU|nr:hypothetical protein [Saccharothrix coeruleofusca]MBP2340009.1 hypothetical protein [Saccharothrix coeruleofusca]GGP38006.1 hypothetical protein GCM10010185_06750 [Saccharothrix coeruleofusca]